MPPSGERRASVFISYRREGGFYLARSIYDYLHAHGHDVFMDVHTLGAGEYEGVTLGQIRSRDHFVMVLTRGSLARMRDEEDWLRKELATALAAKRNIIPLLDVGFEFDADDVKADLAAVPQRLRAIASYNAVRMPPPEYFESGLKRLLLFLKDAPPAVTTSSPQDQAKVAKADRELRSLRMPSADVVPVAERRTLSWHDMQQRLFASPERESASSTTPDEKPSPPLTTFGLMLAAPQLKKALFGTGLEWTEVPGAVDYVLEWDADPAFPAPTVAYRGDRTTHLDFFAVRTQTRHYRVKATGGPVSLRQGRWSNVVTLEATPSTASKQLEAPTLSETLNGLSWTSVPFTDEYVLEKALDPGFNTPREVYRGDRTSFLHVMDLRGIQELGKSAYYRAKAITKFGLTELEGPWSNVVTTRGYSATKLPAPKLTHLPFLGLTWTEVATADEYVVERDDSPDFGSPVVVYQGDKTSHSLSEWSFAGRQKGKGQHHYRVRARRTKPPAREGEWSNTWSDTLLT